MASNQTKRTWKENFKKETSPETRDKICEKLKQITKSKEGLSSQFLNAVLKPLPCFIGIYPQDCIPNLSSINLPCFIIVNTALSTETDGHWIGIGIFEKSIEIYDSLGMNSEFWTREPYFLLSFIKRYNTTHRIFISPVLQNPNSNLCGFYSLFFILSREFTHFNFLLSLFTTDLSLNDLLLIDFLV